MECILYTLWFNAGCGFDCVKTFWVGGGGDGIAEHLWHVVVLA